MSIRTSRTRYDAETRVLIERHGLAEHLDAIDEITQDIYGTSFWLSPSRADSFCTLVVHVGLAEDADPKKTSELMTEWYRRVAELVGETTSHLCLLTEFAAEPIELGEFSTASIKYTRDDAETEMLIERHRLAEHLDALNEITQEIFGTGMWLSASQSDYAEALVVHVSVSAAEEPKKMVELEGVWYGRVEELLGATQSCLRLVIRYQ